MPHFSQHDIQEMHHLYRSNLINSCSGYKSATLVGTKSSTGITNLAVFSSVTHIGSNPALLGIIFRPTTVIRNTYDNIKATGTFTLNLVHEAILEDAHHTSAKYDARVSEFDVTNLEEEYQNDFPAPFVKASPIKIAMSYMEEYSIKANGTILLVGQIKDLYLDDHLLQHDGFINLSQANIAAINGLDGYAIPKLKTRLVYQRPKKTSQNTV
jgi:flavin reductase (DIM6/NTAB) family NADH-FMN oxidoreductase RutF